MTEQPMSNGRGYPSGRPRRFWRHGSLSRRRGLSEKVHYRRRIHRLRKELAKERAKQSRSRGRTEVHWESNDGFTQLHPRVQRGFRDWSHKVFTYTGGPRSPSEMARWDSWTEGEEWGSEEETFKGTREDVVSWIESYSSYSGRPADTRLPPAEAFEELMKRKKEKKKMGTAKGFPSYRPISEQDTYIPNFVRTSEPPREESNVERRKVFDVFLSICIRAYRLIKSFVFRRK